MNNHQRTEPTGYQYIDLELEKIRKTLTEDNQYKFDKLCKQIHSAGFSEGYHLNRPTITEQSIH